MALSQGWCLLNIYIGAWRNSINIGVFVYKIMTLYRMCHCKIWISLTLVASVIVSCIYITSFIGTFYKGHCLSLYIYNPYFLFSKIASHLHQPHLNPKDPHLYGKATYGWFRTHGRPPGPPTNDCWLPSISQSLYRQYLEAYQWNPNPLETPENPPLLALHQDHLHSWQRVPEA